MSNTCGKSTMFIKIIWYNKNRDLSQTFWNYEKTIIYKINKIFIKYYLNILRQVCVSYTLQFNHLKSRSYLIYSFITSYNSVYNFLLIEHVWDFHCYRFIFVQNEINKNISYTCWSYLKHNSNNHIKRALMFR